MRGLDPRIHLLEKVDCRIGEREGALLSGNDTKMDQAWLTHGAHR